MRGTPDFNPEATYTYKFACKQYNPKSTNLEEIATQIETLLNGRLGDIKLDVSSSTGPYDGNILADRNAGYAAKYAAKTDLPCGIEQELPELSWGGVPPPAMPGEPTPPID